MNASKVIQVALIGHAILFEPSHVVAASLTSVKLFIQPSEPVTPFAVSIQYQGWLTTDTIKFDDKDAVSFGGQYVSGAPNGSGTEIAWMIDPKSQGVLDVVEIRYVTVGGVTTIMGRFESFGAKASEGTLPSGVTGVAEQPALVNISDSFYEQSGGVYTPVALPPGLSVVIQPPPPSGLPTLTSVPTPIPSAIWLVGSGLISAFGFARRKAGNGTQA